MPGDFDSYGGGVFEAAAANDDDAPALHAVELIGRRESRGVPNWLAQNSYGPAWGVNGTFMIVRGSNHAGHEGYATVATPKLAGTPL